MVNLAGYENYWRVYLVDKSLIRKEIITKRKAMLKEAKKSCSLNIFQNLKKVTTYSKAKNVMSYMSFKNEVETDKINEDLLLTGKNLYLPHINNCDQMKTKIFTKEEFFISGKYGISESTGEIYNGEIDLVLVPGIAFDKYGGRIGFGKAYYDRFLLDKEVIKVALAYEFQIVDRIRLDSHDILMDYIITENRVINCIENRD